MKFIFSVFACLLFSCATFAGTIKGKISDAYGALPYATVFVEGTTVGVNANGDGDYELTISPGTYKVVCTYVGYKQSSFNITIKGDEAVVHNFKLQDLGTEMKEVVIHASSEDPAYPIIRETIKRRKFHLDQVQSFQTGIYLKGVARSRQMPTKILGQDVKVNDMGVDSGGKGILNLIEEDADYYAQGNRHRTIIHSVRESGRKNGVGFSQFPEVITFYENNIDLFGEGSRGFISPISEGALNYYKYHLLGQFTENGKTIYKIDVKQKRDYEPCFNGVIYIVDEDYAIHSLDMTLARQSGMDMIDTLKISQLFLPLKKDTWVIKSQVLYFTVNLLGFDITGTGVTVYDRQKVNEPIPDSIFAENVISSYDKGANKKDTSYFTKTRPIPLEADEKKDYKVKDSILSRVTSPAYKDSVRRRNNRIDPMGILIGGVSFSSKEYKNTYSFTPLISVNPYSSGVVNYNAVEGLNIAPKMYWTHKIDSAQYINAAMAVRYGFSNTHFNAIARVQYTNEDRQWIGRSWHVGVEGGKYVFQYNPENPISEIYNTVSSLFWHENDLKIYERWDATIFASRNYGNGFRWGIKLAYQQRLPLENTTNYSFFGSQTPPYPDNLPPTLAQRFVWEKHDAVLAHADASYRPGCTYTQYPDYKTNNGSRWPLFLLSYDKGIPNILNSKVDYDKWRLGVKDVINLKLLGSIAYNISAGGFLNTNYVSLPDLMHLYGNRGIGLAAPYLSSFQFAPYYDFSNDERIYGEAHLEYNMNGLLSNKIPLFRQALWYFVAGTNTFYANQNDYYTEAFIGIDNIGYKLLRFLRIDFVQSWDSHGGRNSGIRFGLKTNGTISTGTNDHWEW